MHTCPNTSPESLTSWLQVSTPSAIWQNGVRCLWCYGWLQITDWLYWRPCSSFYLYKTKLQQRSQDEGEPSKTGCIRIHPIFIIKSVYDIWTELVTLTLRHRTCRSLDVTYGVVSLCQVLKSEVYKKPPPIERVLRAWNAQPFGWIPPFFNFFQPFQTWFPPFYLFDALWNVLTRYKIDQKFVFLAF